MNIEKGISKVFGLDDETWLRHANPKSVWTRFIILPFFVLAIWSRTWISWYALIPITVLVIWTAINPKFFKKPATTKSWSSKCVLGEKVWTNRKEIEVPNEHKTMINILTLIQLTGLVTLVFGLYYFNFWQTITGTVLIYLGKMWFLDRMVWLFEDMKEHPEYNHLLY